MDGLVVVLFILILILLLACLFSNKQQVKGGYGGTILFNKDITGSQLRRHVIFTIPQATSWDDVFNSITRDTIKPTLDIQERIKKVIKDFQNNNIPDDVYDSINEAAVFYSEQNKLYGPLDLIRNILQYDDGLKNGYGYRHGSNYRFDPNFRPSYDESLLFIENNHSRRCRKGKGCSRAPPGGASLLQRCRWRPSRSPGLRHR